MDIGADAGEAFEIAVDHRLRLVGGNTQSPGEPPAADAIEDGEVDRLGAAAGVAINHAEHLHRGAGMDVFAGGEGLLELGDIGHVGSETQLDLTVIGSEQDVSGLGDKGVTNLAANFSADRDVLQVRLVRGEPPGLRADQTVAGVHAAGCRVDRCLQRFGVG